MKQRILLAKTALMTAAWLLLGRQPVQAQQPGRASAPGVWFTLSSDARLSRRLGLHADVHWRGGQRPAARPAQNLMRAGLNVHLSEQATASAGYAYLYSLPPSDQPNASGPGAQERRLYQQLQFGEQTGALWTRHRYRLEERWLQAGAAARTCRTRLRYQLQLLLPLRRDHRLTPGTAYLAGANELFVNLGQAPSFFDQNRLSLLLGLQLSGASALEAGVVHQSFTTSPDLDGGPGTVLQVGFAFRPDVRHGYSMSSER